MFLLLYKHTGDGVFEDIPKISDHFPKIFEDFPKLFWRPDERSRTFSENFRKFPKMSEDCRRLPKTIEEDPKMFRWYTNYFKFNLRDKLDSEIIDIFTCEDIISSHVRISYRFYEFVTTRYTTDFYIIKWFLCGILTKISLFIYFGDVIFGWVNVVIGPIICIFYTFFNLKYLQNQK